MLGDISGVNEIYIVCGYTDMRKSIDGLCAIVIEQLHMDPKRSALYLFCGRRCDRLKALLWESDGFVLLYKRLAVEGRYRWPRDKSEVRPLTWQQFDWLMSGLEIEHPKAIGTYKNVDNLLTKYSGCEQPSKPSRSLENTAFLAVNEA
jgi:transposase